MQVKEIQKRAVPILKRHGAIEAYIFGSAARGGTTRRSDIDILVHFNKVPGLFEHIQAKYDLQDALGRKVDLVQADALREEMKPSVNQDKIKIL